MEALGTEALGTGKESGSGFRVQGSDWDLGGVVNTGFARPIGSWECWGQGKRDFNTETRRAKLKTKECEMLGTGKERGSVGDREWRNAGDRERECVGVWVCGEREGSRVQIRFKKVQTRLTALVQKRKAES
jgi:hypothetical protein